ncbi:MAG: tricorn protease, partial [Cryomorphaceae bacterium]
VYRYLFHYYRLDTKTNESEEITLKHNLALKTNKPKDTAIKNTADADFSPSGLEIAFSAKGNIFAMDTVLREPVQLTHTDGHETNIYFGDKGRAIYYIYDDGIKTSINKITKSNSSQYWWETDKVKISTLIASELKSTIKSFSPSPNGKLIGYTTVQGKLFIYDLKTKKSQLITQSWGAPSFNWSPNSEWVTYSLQNNNFNSDIYVVPVDGSQKPVNVTKHPDNEFSPSFSPDGKKLAFIGKRHSTNYDLYYVDLTPKGSDKSARDIKIEKAKKAMKKDPTYATPASKLKSIIKKLTPRKSEEPKKVTPKPAKPTEKPATKPAANVTTSNAKKPIAPDPILKPKPSPTKVTKKSKKAKLSYDLTDIQKRIQHIPLNGMTPSQMFWKNDSKAVLINSKKSGKSTYAFDLKSKKAARYLDSSGSPIRYDSRGDLYWISNGVPAVLKGTKSTNYTFVAQTEFDLAQHQKYKFRLIWRTIGDGFYDEAMNGTNWDNILTKYEDAATNAESGESFDRIVSMLLGELNASHTGYRGQNTSGWRKRVPWREEMLHLGVKHTAKADGWHITKVFTNSPANGKLSKLKVGEIITEINETKVNDETLLKEVLWGQLKDSILLKVCDKDGEERRVNLTPISYTTSRGLVSADQISENKAMVEKLSNGKFGYIHVARMQWDEFKRFEQHLYENGAGKDGIIIDVRDNGGGFTTDHLLTALTQPRHAYTVPRNGGLGYPQDRFVYATWEKPIVVLCNQNSFSNAEIFSHAIKTLKRGKLVGVPTAGGVISTGSADILKEGTLRMPFRGWFLSTNGEDMELNGATPELENIIWPLPGELETGIDKQIEKAIEVLADEVKTKQKTSITPKYRNRK